jgi:hypothetical protein
MTLQHNRIVRRAHKMRVLCLLRYITMTLCQQLTEVQALVAKLAYTLLKANGAGLI